MYVCMYVVQTPFDVESSSLIFAPRSYFDSFYDKIHSVTGLAVAELKHLEHHMLQVRQYCSIFKLSP